MQRHDIINSLSVMVPGAQEVLTLASLEDEDRAAAKQLTRLAGQMVQWPERTSYKIAAHQLPAVRGLVAEALRAGGWSVTEEHQDDGRLCLVVSRP
jgi:hypothetical protein